MPDLLSVDWLFRDAVDFPSAQIIFLLEFKYSVFHNVSYFVRDNFVTHLYCPYILFVLFDDGVPLKAVWGIFDLGYIFQIDKDHRVEYQDGSVDPHSILCAWTC